MVISDLLTEAELEILQPRQTVLSELWHQDFTETRSQWMNAMPAYAAAIYGDPRWRVMQLNLYDQAVMYVHRIMSRNMQAKYCTRLGDTFPMEVDRMTEDYSGMFDCTRDETISYMLFQDPYYGSWILVLLQHIFRVGGSIVTTYEISHGGDAIMFLSEESSETL